MTMTCEQVRDSLSAYVDDSLPASEAVEVAGHLSECSPCAGAYASMLDVRRRLQEELVSYRAPDALRARIQMSLAGEALQRQRRGARRVVWQAAAALLLVAGGAGATMVATRGRGTTADGASLSSQILASHFRSLMSDHLTDVESTDQHTVKPWFAGRLDFSPPVPRLDSAGFPLLGGRVDYVAGHPAAALVYARRGHRINLFVWPDASAGEKAARLQSERGYQLVHWSHGGLMHWAASDLNAAELLEFAALIVARD